MACFSQSSSSPMCWYTPWPYLRPFFIWCSSCSFRRKRSKMSKADCWSSASLKWMKSFILFSWELYSSTKSLRIQSVNRREVSYLALGSHSVSELSLYWSKLFLVSKRGLQYEVSITQWGYAREKEFQQHCQQRLLCVFSSVQNEKRCPIERQVGSDLWLDPAF